MTVTPTYLSPTHPTPILDLFWRFAAERQRVFFRRLEGSSMPWTEDLILREYRFTNTFRASDRVSQYLIKHIIEAAKYDTESTFFRILLFKLFNSIETWKAIEDAFGPISAATTDIALVEELLHDRLGSSKTIYSPAYIMPPGPRRLFASTRKHEFHLRLLLKMLDDNVPERVHQAEHMSNVFDLLIGYPGIGRFLAFQYTIDINYSDLTNFSENQYVVAGPGAVRGIRKCFSDTGGLSDIDIIALLTKYQDDEFDRLDIDFPSLYGRRLHLIDVQNLFCEIDKYTRVSHPELSRSGLPKRIKRSFSPKSNVERPEYPSKWALDTSTVSKEWL